MWDALSQMQPCKAKALGPDGMHVLFYQNFWHIMDDDVIAVVNGIIHGKPPPDTFNKTNIVLILKTKSPTMVYEFRAISLCNVIYKIASKVLAN